ncbi:hypothetical protein R83H12_03036 [Fibrobacteria bacterium R8-3-H12]
MLTDTVLRRKGLDALTQSLGILDSERFISLILSEPFDYIIRSGKKISMAICLWMNFMRK